MMTPTAPPFQKLSGSVLDGFRAEVAALYRRMDRTYQTAAAAYGFHCTGCRDNCCYTRFHHHTVIEWLYIHDGFTALELSVQRDIVARCRKYCRQMRAISSESQNRLPVICPVNEADRCRIYHHRPMICRLHGIPHQLKTPGRPTVSASGCHLFERDFGGRAEARIDRTPLYAEMALLERRTRQTLGLTEKIKMTVAEMILALDPDRRATTDGAADTLYKPGVPTT